MAPNGAASGTEEQDECEALLKIRRDQCRITKMPIRPQIEAAYNVNCHSFAACLAIAAAPPQPPPPPPPPWPPVLPAAPPDAEPEPEPEPDPDQAIMLLESRKVLRLA